MYLCVADLYAVGLKCIYQWASSVYVCFSCFVPLRKSFHVRDERRLKRFLRLIARIRSYFTALPIASGNVRTPQRAIPVPMAVPDGKIPSHLQKVSSCQAIYSLFRLQLRRKRLLSGKNQSRKSVGSTQKSKNAPVAGRKFYFL